MAKTPLATVKERFGDKASLVKAIQGLATAELWNDARLNDDKGLACVSNAKLLHLHDVLSAVKEQFGTRDKLIEAIAEARVVAKDGDFKTSLNDRPTPDLYEIYRAAKKRSGKSAA